VVTGLVPAISTSLNAEAWAVVWKQDGGKVRDFLLSFGFSASPEEALSKVEARVKHDPRFRREHGGGVFYPIPVHLNLPVPSAVR